MVRSANLLSVIFFFIPTFLHFDPVILIYLFINEMRIPVNSGSEDVTKCFFSWCRLAQRPGDALAGTLWLTCLKVS